jgi:CubicO group peptidase (beta-lactamase class C family)
MNICNFTNNKTLFDFIKHKKILFLTFVVYLFSFEQIAEGTDVIVPDIFTIDNARLTNEFSTGEEFLQVEKTIEAFMRKWNIVGASVAIAKDGQLMYSRGFGYADSTLKTIVQPYHKFRVASISKLVSAVAIMKLVEEGRLSLNDRIFGTDGILNDSYFNKPLDARAYDITVEHLLSHAGGWDQRFGDHMFIPLVIAKAMGVEPPVDVKTIVRFALNRRLHFAPGTRQSYSNLGYSILDLVIEKITGQTYEEYCKQFVLKPLGIYDMSIAGNMPDEKAVFEVSYYQPKTAALRPSIYGTGEMSPSTYGANDIRTLGGAGAWIATAPDLMRLLLGIDGFSSRPDILSPESIHTMTGNRSAPLGWRSANRDGAWLRTGSFSGTSGIMKRENNGIAWVVLFNTSTWNGGYIHNYTTTMMDEAISQIEEWPRHNLFHYSLPVPVFFANR